MKLTVNREDLKFKHFKPEVQEAIRKVDRARFEQYDKSSSNVIMSG